MIHNVAPILHTTATDMANRTSFPLHDFVQKDRTILQQDLISRFKNNFFAFPSLPVADLNSHLKIHEGKITSQKNMLLLFNHLLVFTLLSLLSLHPLFQLMDIDRLLKRKTTFTACENRNGHF